MNLSQKALEDEILFSLLYSVKEASLMPVDSKKLHQAISAYDFFVVALRRKEGLENSYAQC